MAYILNQIGCMLAYTGCGLTISTFWDGRIGRAETRIMASVEYF